MMKASDLNRARLFWLALGVLCLLRLALTAFAIEVYPSPARDEVIWGAVASFLLRSGHIGVGIWPDRYGLAQNYVVVGRLFILYLAGVFWLFGTGFAQARWAIAIATFLSAIFLALGLRKLYSAAHGLIAAALYLFSWNMFYHSHYVRPEVVSLMGSLGLFYWFVERRHTPSGLAFFSWGLVNGLLLDIHLSSAHLIVAMDVLIVVDTLHRRTGRYLLWLFGGHAAGLLYWLIVHLLPNPLIALHQVHMLWSFVVAPSVGLESGLAGRILAALYNFRSQFVTLTRLSPLQFGLIGIGGVIAVRYWRRHWPILLPAASLLVTLLVVVPATEHGYYLFILMPWLSAAMTVAAMEWYAYFGQPPMSRWQMLRWVYGSAIGLLFIGYLVGNLMLTWNNRTIDYEGMAGQLSRLAPVTANVIADAIWFYAYHAGEFTDYPFTFADAPDLRSPEGAPRSLDSFFAERHIEYALLNENPLYVLHSATEIERHKLFTNYVAIYCHYVGHASADLYGAELGVDFREMRIAVHDCRERVNGGDTAPP